MAFDLDQERVVLDTEPVGDMPPRIFLTGQSCDTATYTVGVTPS